MQRSDRLLAGIDPAARELHLLGVDADLMDTEQATAAAEKEAVDAKAVAVGPPRHPRLTDAFHRRWMT